MAPFKPRLVKSDSSEEPPQAQDSDARPIRIQLRAAGERIPPRREGQVYAGRFRLQTCLERRGSVERHLALQEPMVRRVLLEVLTEEGERADAFLMDAGALAGLRHESLCTVYDLGRSEDGSAWRSSEVMHGFDLRELLHQGPLARVRLRALVRDVTEAMAELHQAGVVHGNLSPDSVMLEQNVDDDELARIGSYGTHGRSNPSLRPPEGTVGTMASDVWAMGLLFHLAATGKRCRAGKLDESLPEFLVPVLKACLCDVEERLPDAIAVRNQLPFRSVVSAPAAPPPMMVMPGTTLGPAASQIIEPQTPPPALTAAAPTESPAPEQRAPLINPYLLAVMSGVVAGVVAALILKAFL